jgi:manganese transport protein
MNHPAVHRSGPEAPDTRIVALAHGVLRGKHRSGIGRLLPFLGPTFIASVAYMDPGNFATNIEGERDSVIF